MKLILLFVPPTALIYSAVLCYVDPILVIIFAVDGIVWIGLPLIAVCLALLLVCFYLKYVRERKKNVTSLSAAPMKSIVVATLGAVASLAVILGCQRTPVPGGDSPVTTERLVGSNLVDIRDGPSWTFSDSVVVIENKDQPIPPDLVQDLLGTRTTPKRIEATWRFDDKMNMLHLSNAKADGMTIGSEIGVPIQPAGHVRVNLGSRQYNLVRNGAKAP